MVPRIELHRKGKDMKKFEATGKILTHSIILTKTIPTFIARSTLLLIGNIDAVIPTEVLREDFLLFLTYGERELIKKAKTSFDTMETFEKEMLTDFFTTNSFFDNPKKEEIDEQIDIIAENALLATPREAIKHIKNGIPVVMDIFWSSLTLEKLNNIVVSQTPTPNKIIQCLKCEQEDLNLNQSAALYYLKTFIRNLNKKELTNFLNFITGSSNMPNTINITFTNFSGSSRRPIAHTCSNLLELPCTYNDLNDFSREFTAILASDFSFQYSQL